MEEEPTATELKLVQDENQDGYVDFADTRIAILITPEGGFTMMMTDDMREILEGITYQGPVVIQIPWNSQDLKIYSIRPEDYEQLIKQIGS